MCKESQLEFSRHIDPNIIRKGNVAASVRNIESQVTEMPKSKTPPPLPPKPKAVQNNLSQMPCNKGKNTPAFFRPISQNLQKDSKVELKNKNIDSNIVSVSIKSIKDNKITMYGKLKENLNQFGKIYKSVLKEVSSEETPPEKTSNNRYVIYHARLAQVIEHSKETQSDVSYSGCSR